MGYNEGIPNKEKTYGQPDQLARDHFCHGACGFGVDLHSAVVPLDDRYQRSQGEYQWQEEITPGNHRVPWQQVGTSSK